MVMGFIILVGTILGILIDGIQHTLEKYIFENCQEFKDLDAERASLYPTQDIKHFYYYTRDREAFTHLTNNYYRYAEFYGNIAISLIAFSCIAPFYFRDILEITKGGSFILGCLVPLVLAGFCIWSSYETFFKYHRFRIDLIYGILRLTKSIQFTKKEIPATVDKSVEITAQLKEWTLAGLEQEDLEKVEECVKNDCKLNDDENLRECLKKYKVWKASDVPPNDVEIIFETSGEYLFKKDPNKNGTNGASKEITEGDSQSLISKIKRYVSPIISSILNLLGASTPPKTTKAEKMIQKETEDANATVWFKSNKSATVTASSKDFISGTVKVNVNNKNPNNDTKEGKKKENEP
jgi:hypothetical protein